MKLLIIIPIAVMLLIGLLAITGLGAVTTEPLAGTHIFKLDYTSGGGYYDQNGDGILYDENNNPICYYNLSAVAGQEQGEVLPLELARSAYTYATWKNSTGEYMLCSPTSPLQFHWISFDQIDGSYQYWQAQADNASGQFSYVLGGPLGLIALITGLMAVGVIVGFHFFGGGESAISVEFLLKGTFFITIWTVLTGLAYNLVLASGFYMFLIYFALTIAYAIGIITSIGGGNDL